MLNSNATCQIRRMSGTDVYGRPNFDAPVTERCAIIKLRGEIRRESPRAENSGDRSHGEEFVSSNEILLDGKTIARLGDQINIRGYLIRIIGMRDRMDVNGRIDHFEVSGALWA